MRRALLPSLFFFLYSGLAIVASANNSWDIAILVRDAILFYTRDMALKQQFLIKEIPILSEVAYDDDTQTMYMADAVRMSIFSVKLTEESYTATKIIQLNNTIFKAMAFDPLSRTLFWINSLEKSIVKLHVPLDGKPGSPVVVHNFPKLNLQSITVDACKRHIYWSHGNGDYQGIERINYDGSNRTIVVEKKLHFPAQVEMNYAERRLYWLDFISGFKAKIERSNLNGSKRKLIVRVKTYTPAYLVTDRDTIYWLDMLNLVGWKYPKNATKNDYPMIILTTSDHQIMLKNFIVRDNIVNCSSVPLTEDETHVSDSRMSSDGEYLEDEYEDGTIPFCLNNGVLNETELSCACQPGYKGLICEISLCRHYCLHGECFINKYGLPECKCPGPFDGNRCEKDICDNYCLNDGVCSYQNGKASCACKNSTGTRCQYHKNMHNI